MDDRKISIWIDGYDDLFSDFDSRPYSGRSLSDDFTGELRKVCQETNELISELKLELPGGIRKAEEEAVIIKRLNNHIKKNLHHYTIAIDKIKKRGIAFLVFGFLLMILVSYLSIAKIQLWAVNIALVVFEPAGWFLVWAGFDMLLYSSRHDRTELDFYHKLSKAKILFGSN
ncbi:MAG: hypothetical protein HYU69_12325 [Bacteroidetes bacterium]|nr:hypothetical protein [Bacteroidota bacterium]